MGKYLWTVCTNNTSIEYASTTRHIKTFLDEIENEGFRMDKIQSVEVRGPITDLAD